MSISEDTIEFALRRPDGFTSGDLATEFVIADSRARTHIAAVASELISTPLRAKGNPLRYWHRTYAAHMAVFKAEQARELSSPTKLQKLPTPVAAHRQPPPMQEAHVVYRCGVKVTIGPSPKPAQLQEPYFSAIGFGRYYDADTAIARAYR